MMRIIRTSIPRPNAVYLLEIDKIPKKVYANLLRAGHKPRKRR